MIERDPHPRLQAARGGNLWLPTGGARIEDEFCPDSGILNFRFSVHPRILPSSPICFSPAGAAVRQSKTMASGRKPVIVRKFSRDWTAGYARAWFGQAAAELEILDLAGKVLQMPWESVKWVCYVRDFNMSSVDQSNPERLLHKRFTVRPRAAGLWLRMTLTDGDELEGLAANDRSLVDGAGLLLTPPDMRSNTQRIYIPRLAIQALEVVSLIGAPARRRPAPAAQPEEQPGLFPGETG
jgi:hypothetical protein